MFRRTPLLQVIDRSNARNYTKVRLVGGEGNELVTIYEALERADAEGLDLVIVSDQGDLPVVRIQDFKKIQYQKKKAKKTQTRRTTLKEIQFKVNISDHDFNTKLANIVRFIERGDKVKIMVRLKGRERETPERASAIIDRVIENVKCRANKIPGPIATALLEPIGSK